MVLPPCLPLCPFICPPSWSPFWAALGCRYRLVPLHLSSNLVSALCCRCRLVSQACSLEMLSGVYAGIFFFFQNIFLWFNDGSKRFDVEKKIVWVDWPVAQNWLCVCVIGGFELTQVCGLSRKQSNIKTHLRPTWKTDKYFETKGNNQKTIKKQGQEPIFTLNKGCCGSD